MSAVKQIRTALPFVVGLGILTFLLINVDIGPALEQATARTAVVLGTALLAFGFFSLWLEARSLKLLVPRDMEFDIWDAMRIKCASYIVNIINIALGIGAIAYLLKRRFGLPLTDGAGIVTLIAILDLSLLIVVGGLGASAIASSGPALRFATLLAGLGAIVVGFALLRTKRSLGPLEPIRQLDLFRSARSTDAITLLELALLRALMVASFLALNCVPFYLFEIGVPIGPLLLGIVSITLVTSIPIAVAGLGTGQATFLYFFKDYADESTLLAASLSLAIGFVILRGSMGLTLAGEFTREALAASRGEEA